ncbi:hypothetical protein EVAR_12059_1 [Eumeta japonica]|uniref:Uncharacterized protein n=1 Tax=Eumeta variegata TaxID=151549 RepID=A0A4C1U5B6_EUMVA|nr:hypothetical protein EVAR_12059_1 [Eumeta japonica]
MPAARAAAGGGRSVRGHCSSSVLPEIFSYRVKAGGVPGGKLTAVDSRVASRFAECHRVRPLPNKLASIESGKQFVQDGHQVLSRVRGGDRRKAHYVRVQNAETNMNALFVLPGKKPEAAANNGHRERPEEDP